MKMVSSTMEDQKSINVQDSSDARNSEAAMDQYLQSIGLYRKPVAKDGSCLFRAVAEKIYNTQAKHLEVRHECISYMKKNSDRFSGFITGSFEHHLFDLQNPKEWAGQVEITALSMLYKHDIVVYQEINQPPRCVTDNGFKDKILLCFSNGNHYDCVFPYTFKENAALQQSILYEHLYKTVLPECQRRDEKKPKAGMKSGDVSTNSNSMLGNKGKEDATSSNLLWEIKRSLDPSCYRNVALEVWEQSKQEQTKMDKALARRLQFKIGEYCYFHMKGSDTPNEKLNARIDDYLADQETYLVYVPEHKDSYYVPVDCLSPILSNSEKPDQISYNELPGYYRKTEDPPKDNMGNFQYPKKRQKGGNIRGGRDDDFRGRRFDNRNDQRYENRTEGRFEGRNDGSGYQRRDRRDRRGAGGSRGGRNDRNDRKDSERAWKPNERGNRKQDASRVLSPIADPNPQDVKVSGSDVVVVKKVEEQDTLTSPSEGAVNPEFPTLKPQEKENTAKQDESPAAFWQRMRKPLAAGCEDAKPQTTRSGTHIAEKEINRKSIAATENKPSDTPQDKVIDKAKGVGTQVPAETSNIAAKNEVKQESVAPANETRKASESNVSIAKEHVTRKLTRLALDDSDAKNIVEPTGINNEIANQVVSKGGIKEVSEDLKAVTSKPQTSDPSAIGDVIPKEVTNALNEENADEMRNEFVFTNQTCNGGVPPAFIDSQLSNEQQTEHWMESNDKSTEDLVGSSSIAAQGQVNCSTLERVQQGSKLAAITTDNQSSLENTGSKALQGHQAASFSDHMVSFPSGFDAPMDTECADSTDDVGKSSPITFMSQSDISTESVDGVDDGSSANTAGKIIPKTQASAEQERPTTQTITAEPTPETKAEQKNEQRIRILTKENKDKFDYLNTNNENNASVDIPLSSVSRERSPEPEGGRKGQSKKVSFGDVTEISQTSSSEVHTQPNTVMSEVMPNSYVDTNGETNDQMYYDESGNFNPTIGMHAPVLPMMMHPMVAGNEQIQYPQTFSMDPEGKDLPNHIPTIRYFFNMGLQFFYMQQQPPAFINVPVSQMRAPAMQIPPQAVQNQAPSQLQMQQRFQAPMDPSNQLPPHEQPDDYMAVSSAAPGQYELLQQQQQQQQQQQSLAQGRPLHLPSQSNGSQYEQPPRMRRGRGRGSALGQPMSISRGYNIYNQTQQPQQQQQQQPSRGGRRTFSTNYPPDWQQQQQPYY